MINNWLFLLGMAEIKFNEKLAGILLVVGLILMGVAVELYMNYAVEYEVMEKMNYAGVMCSLLGVCLLSHSVSKRFAIFILSPREEE